jgi:very-short-patch-repair endonuclease
MTGRTLHSTVWALARAQHGVVARAQLLERGLTRHAIAQRLARGRLHPVARGVYAVGRPELTRYGRWMAAVLSCGPEAMLSHQSAAELWEIRPPRSTTIHITVPTKTCRNRLGITLHRRAVKARAHRHGIPTTPPAQTLLDLAATLTTRQLEAAINEADKRDLVHPEALRQAADEAGSQRGVAKLKSLLDRQTFVLTDTDLERLFLPIARRAGLEKPRTQVWVNGFRVDFFWPDLGLVVETDGGRYHRTPAQQTTDRIRDQAHAAAGLIPLRFTHGQVKFDPRHVEATLKRVARARAAAPAPDRTASARPRPA